MLRTNVIKHEYNLLIREKETNETQIISVTAESLEAAALKIPDGWEFVEYAKVGIGFGKEVKT